MRPRPLTSAADVHAALPGSLLLRQIARKWAADRPAYALGGAVGVYHAFGPDPDLVIMGDPGDAVALARAFRERHPDLPYRMSVPRAGGDRLVAEDGLVSYGGWAFRWTDVPPAGPAAGEGAWLALSDLDGVRDLLARGFPTASAPVGHPDVRRWAGLRRDGRLVAVAADTTIVPGLGFLASITTEPDARGTGAGAAVTAWAAAGLVAEHGVCGLWHESDNVVAAALYTRLGFHDDDQMAVVGAP